MRAQKRGQKAGSFEMIVGIRSLEAHSQKQASTGRHMEGEAGIADPAQANPDTLHKGPETLALPYSRYLHLKHSALDSHHDVLVHCNSQLPIKTGCTLKSFLMCPF